jgi:tetratricopeptide (TPR) repeat protein
MDFRKDVVGFALSRQNQRLMDELAAWIGAEPSNPRPYHRLALMYRLELREEEALGLLLESVSLDPSFAPAHATLAEVYAIRGDYPAAWRHARAAESSGDATAAEMLTRHNIPG